ncbi:hypothetical protein BDW68DRAFT_70907 [Aspergillus falconensis]
MIIFSALFCLHVIIRILKPFSFSSVTSFFSLLFPYFFHLRLFFFPPPPLPLPRPCLAFSSQLHPCLPSVFPRHSASILAFASLFSPRRPRGCR